MDPNQPPFISSPGIPTPEHKRFRIEKKTRLFLLTLLIIITVSIAGFFIFKPLKKETSPPGITDTLISAPLYEFSGTIEGINNNTLTVTNTSFISPESSASYTQTAMEKKTTYEVTTTDQTKIISNPPSVPYSLKLTTDSAIPKKEFSELKVGQQISVISKENIRTLLSNNFTAESITVQPGMTVITGEIMNVDNKVVLLKATPPAVSEPNEYQIIISDDTEIVDYFVSVGASGTPNKTKQLPMTELAEGIMINVYTDSDINLNDTTKALKIEVIKQINLTL